MAFCYCTWLFNPKEVAGRTLLTRNWYLTMYTCGLLTASTSPNSLLIALEQKSVLCVTRPFLFAKGRHQIVMPWWVEPWRHTCAVVVVCMCVCHSNGVVSSSFDCWTSLCLYIMWLSVCLAFVSNIVILSVLIPTCYHRTTFVVFVVCIVVNVVFLV